MLNGTTNQPLSARELAHQLEGRREGSYWKARCPAHDDKVASLSISEGDGAKVLVKCHAGCTQEALIATLRGKGLWPHRVSNGARQRAAKAVKSKLGRVVATYDYTDPTGKLLFQAVRYDPKDFRQRRRDGSGGYIWNLNGVQIVPYRLAELNVEPWPEPVSGAELLKSICTVLNRYMILPKHAAEAMALWILHAWTMDAWEISPILIIVSPVPQCGKSTLMTLLYWLTPRSELVSNATASPIFRSAPVTRRMNGNKKDENAGIALLRDIKKLFDENKETSFGAEALVQQLINLPETPWAEWRRGEKPITSRGVAKMLAAFDIYSDDKHRPRLYRAKDFDMAWSAYLPIPPVLSGTSG